MTISTFFRRLPAAPIAILLCALPMTMTWTGCTTAKYKKTDVADNRLATPPHDLPAGEYPFDHDGTYRKDWVANPSSARRSPPPRRTVPPVSTSAPPQTAHSAYPAPAPMPGPPPAYTPPPPPRPKPAPTPRPAAAKPARYHTVVKGDTLFSISKRYGATVPKLKSTNGLSSDTIRIGQTLRVP